MSIHDCRLLVIGLCGAVLGCTGLVDGQAPSNGAPGSTEGAATNQPGASAGSGASTSDPASDPGLAGIHRLNTAEYNATVADVLGTSLQPATDNWRGGEIDGFDNMAAVLGVDDAQYALYLDAAEQISKDVFANDGLRQRLVTCATADDACVKTIVSLMGLKLFRRPLQEAELTRYIALYASAKTQGFDHDAAARSVLWAFLSSAEFLYRMEFDEGNQAKHAISGYELASRLSYFLWSSAPDDALLAGASDLNSDQAVAGAVQRMLADPKSARLTKNFGGQWLGARKVLAHPVAATVYPSWSPDIASAASDEVYAYFDEFLHGGRPWPEFMTADVNFVNDKLAAFYGMNGVSPTAQQRVEYAPDSRAGFMSLVGFLAVSSVAGRSSPTLRGKWVLENLLCSPPPPAPANVPKLEDGAQNPTSTNVRDVLQAHRANPACAACHAIIDPVGLALEKFDGVGHFRTNYPDGSAIDTSTTATPSAAFPNGATFDGLDQASKAVSESPKFKECIAEKLYQYGLGRVLDDADKLNAAAIVKEWETDGRYDVGSLVRVIASSAAFRERNPMSAK